jgi:hypothetical protein
MPPRVFVPQVPSRFDRTNRIWLPTVNLQAAERYGEVITILPPNANRAAIAPLVDAMRSRLQDFTSEDWLVAVGDPSLIAAASCIAAKNAGGTLNLLKWDKLVSDYIPVKIRL